MLIMTLCTMTMSLCRHAMGGADSGIMVCSLVMRCMACLMLIGVPLLAGRLSPPAMPVHRAHKAEHREKLTESASDFCLCACGPACWQGRRFVHYRYARGNVQGMGPAPYEALLGGGTFSGMGPVFWRPGCLFYVCMGTCFRSGFEPNFEQ